ncbi:surface antigen-domain-containing protein [Podospora fimiseda]|uniref:Surface antigen-domain-containing protein n=1 Tax=Podospora fimiseda TaxID=252190 RepID=A0AAN7GPE4_9PEZI|nr:surface antigen-domain-containing protein [Podospora fimiseda]
MANFLGTEAPTALDGANTTSNPPAHHHKAYKASTHMLDEHYLTPASIASIEVHGATNTRRSLLNHIFNPLVESSSPGSPSTLGDVLGRLSVATRKLSRFDIFKEDAFNVFISEAKRTESVLPTNQTELNISISVKEKSRLVVSAGTDFGNVEGSAYTNALFRNIFGGAETLSVNASTGTRTRSAYNATFTTPVNGNPDLRVALDLLRSTTQKPWASHEEHLTGGNLRFSWLGNAKNETHTLTYSSIWRQLTDLYPTASPTVRADAGDSLKSSLTHTFTRDRRDNPMLPQSGYLLRSVSELAGWGPLNGDVSFAKTELETSGAVPVPIPGVKGNTGISLGAGLRFGLLYPLPLGYALTGPATPSRINDRFQLGGPTDVRGFKLGGLGPHDNYDSVGGDVFAAGSVNMLLPLPRTDTDSPLRLHLFANGGRLVALQNQNKSSEEKAFLKMGSNQVFHSVKSAVGELGNGLPSIAAGVGLVYAHPVARFELNFSLPVVLRKGEEGRKGLQVGVGIKFL